MKLNLFFSMSMLVCMSCYAMQEVPVASAPSGAAIVQPVESQVPKPSLRSRIKGLFIKTPVLHVNPLNPVQVDGTESLLTAVLQKKEQLVLWHVIRGADVNERSSNGWAPLHYAARDRNGLIARILLASDAIEAHILTPDGKTPLDILSQRRLSVTENQTEERIDPITRKPYATVNYLEDYEKRTLYIIKLYKYFDNQAYPFVIKDNALVWQKDGKKIIELSGGLPK